MNQKKLNQKKVKAPRSSYPGLLSEVKERIRAAQYEALKAVNTELVGLYWDIGRMIVARQADEGVLRGKWRFSKTRTTNARNWLEPQTGHSFVRWRLRNSL